MRTICATGVLIFIINLNKRTFRGCYCCWCFAELLRELSEVALNVGTVNLLNS